MALGVARFLAAGCWYAGFKIRRQVGVLYLRGEDGKKSTKGRPRKIARRLDLDR